MNFITIFFAIGLSSASFAGTNPKETDTYKLGSSACGRGYCSCVTGGRLNVPNQGSADAICKVKGFDYATKFNTTRGRRYVWHCSANGGGCFINKNPGNIVCTSVTCAHKCNAGPVPDTECESDIFHPDTKRCIPSPIANSPNKYYFTKTGVCIPVAEDVSKYCTELSPWNQCEDKIAPEISLNLPPPEKYDLEKSAGTALAVGDSNYEEELIDLSKEARRIYSECMMEIIEEKNKKLEEKAKNGEIVTQEFVEQLDQTYNSSEKCIKLAKKSGGIGIVTTTVNQSAQTITESSISLDRRFIKSNQEEESSPKTSTTDDNNKYIKSFSPSSSPSSSRESAITPRSLQSNPPSVASTNRESTTTHASTSHGAKQNQIGSFSTRYSARKSSSPEIKNFKIANFNSSRNTSSEMQKKNVKSVLTDTTIKKIRSHGDDRSIFERVSYQYHQNSQQLLTLDSYIRNQKRDSNRLPNIN